MVGVINIYEVILHIPNQISVHNREHWMWILHNLFAHILLLDTSFA